MYPMIVLAAASLLGGIIVRALTKKDLDNLEVTGERLFPYISNSQRDSLFGPIKATAAPTASNPEAITITNDFAKKNLVARHYPELAGVPGASGGTIYINKKAADSLAAVLAELKRRDLLRYVETWAGSYVPRFVRGSSTSFSAHSYGTAIDLNAGTNGQGRQPTTRQIAIAKVFVKHGWFWGEWFKPTRDPMHFEYIGRDSA